MKQSIILVFVASMILMIDCQTCDYRFDCCSNLKLNTEGCEDEENFQQFLCILKNHNVLNDDNTVDILGRIDDIVDALKAVPFDKIMKCALKSDRTKCIAKAFVKECDWLENKTGCSAVKKCWDSKKN